MSEAPRGPFLPLPMALGPSGRSPPDPSSERRREIRVEYVRYRDPTPLEFPDRPERLPGPVFHVAGVLLREDEEFLALGEVAFGEENTSLAGRFGPDLFPAYRNVLTIPKSSIEERRELLVVSRPGPDP